MAGLLQAGPARPRYTTSTDLTRQFGACPSSSRPTYDVEVEATAPAPTSRSTSIPLSTPWACRPRLPWRTSSRAKANGRRETSSRQSRSGPRRAPSRPRRVATSMGEGASCVQVYLPIDRSVVITMRRRSTLCALQEDRDLGGRIRTCDRPAPAGCHMGSEAGPPWARMQNECKTRAVLRETPSYRRAPRMARKLPSYRLKARLAGRSVLACHAEAY